MDAIGRNPAKTNWPRWAPRASHVPLILRAALCAVSLYSLTADAVAGEARASDREALKRTVVQHHTALMLAEYQDSLEGARNLRSKIGGLLDAPSAQTLEAARAAWIAARVPYLQTEAARFYDGPIEEVEGMINSWPIDENYIDYTTDDPDAGVINHPAQYPKIDKAALASINEQDGEKNISTGFHAIEFLLWGQDLNENGPGARPATDFANSPGAPSRRREYLKTAADLLVEHLQRVTAAWEKQPGSTFANKLAALPPDEALALIMKGLGSLSGPELRGERLTVAYATKEQENEHSCFSDTTHQDFVGNQLGIQNIYLGRYRRTDGSIVEGPGLRDLLQDSDSALAKRLTAEIQGSLDALKSIPEPFDRAMQGRDTDPGRVAIKKAIDALGAQTDTIVKAATMLQLQLNL